MILYQPRAKVRYEGIMAVLAPPSHSGGIELAPDYTDQSQVSAGGGWGWGWGVAKTNGVLGIK